MPITQGNNISLCLTFDQVEETKHVYDQLIEKGSEVLKTFSPEFYTEGYGYVRDPMVSLCIYLQREKLGSAAKLKNKCLISILK